MHYIIHILLTAMAIQPCSSAAIPSENNSGYYLYYKSQILTSPDSYEITEFLIYISDTLNLDSFNILLAESFTDVDKFNSKLVSSQKVFIDFQSMANFKFYHKDLTLDTSIIVKIRDQSNYILCAHKNFIKQFGSADGSSYCVDIAILQLDVKLASFKPVNSNAGFYKIIDLGRGYLSMDKNLTEPVGLIAVTNLE